MHCGYTEALVAQPSLLITVRMVIPAMLETTIDVLSYVQLRSSVLWGIAPTCIMPLPCASFNLCVCLLPLLCLHTQQRTPGCNTPGA